MSRIVLLTLLTCILSSLSAQAQRPRARNNARINSAPNSAPNFANGFDQFANGFFGESDAERQTLEDVTIDIKEERRIGDADLQNYLQGLKQRRVSILERGSDFDYITALVKSIRPLMQNAKRYASVRVLIADSEETDAHAFPGGSIVVTTGMIKFATSEAALVGVLGHELSHIDHGHQLRTARAGQLATQGWQSAAANPQQMQQQMMLMAKNFAKPFRAEDEATADHDGARWAFELGYDPLELANVFDRLDQRDNKRQPNNQNAQAWMPSFMRTHPSYENRLTSIRQWSQELQTAHPQKKLYVGRANLEHRTPRALREFPE